MTGRGGGGNDEAVRVASDRLEWEGYEAAATGGGGKAVEGRV